MPPLRETPALAALFATSRKVAESPSPHVLIYGERGSGIEDVARFIHQSTPRSRARDFVAVHCSGVREDALERSTSSAIARLASQVSKGADRARSITLFFDDVSVLGPGAQEQLATMLERQRQAPPRRAAVVVRVVAGSRRSLGQLGEARLFREDLLHALSIVRLRVPPLRERPEDIIPTAEVLLREQMDGRRRKLRGISPEAMQRLRTHSFPGNLQELEAVIERAVILETGDMLSAESLAFEDEEGEASSSCDDAFSTAVRINGTFLSLTELERTYIAWLLKRVSGNKTAIARILRVSYPTVAKKIADYKLETPKRRAPPEPASSGGGSLSR